MNKKNLFSLVLAGCLFSSQLVSATDNPVKAKANPMPDNVKSIIEKSCFGCHNTDSKNEDAKEDLDFKAFDTLTKVEKVHALREIHKIVDKDEMPPEKFLQKYPDKKLTEAEKKILLDWAKTEAKSLTKKQN